MKRCYVPKKFSDDSLAIISQADSIINTYQQAGYRMTLRQLYYQFVSKNLLANTERNYKRLGSILNDARYAGMIDWSAIEDRNRQPYKIGEFSGLGSLANAALSSYRLDRWQGQDNFAELWVEKAALAGVLQPLADAWHVTLMVNRGYSSASAMYEAATRLNHRRGQKLVVIYLGDHDPSGEDMVRDIATRFQTFRMDVEVRKLALTMAQVKQYNPPPNPAKMSDSRASNYVALHGSHSWEVDALPPNVLADLIHDEFRSLVDPRQMKAVIADEKADKVSFADALDQATNGKSTVDRNYLSVDIPPFKK